MFILRAFSTCMPSSIYHLMLEEENHNDGAHNKFSRFLMGIKSVTEKWKQCNYMQ